jgi:hypothetical protein
MKKIERLFEYQNGEVITESEDKKCDCGGNPCTCDVKEGDYIEEDSEGEETFNYGEDEGEDYKEEEHLEDEEEMAPHDRIKEIKKHLEALEDDMSYDEDHEDRDEEGTDFSESKKYSKVLKNLSESQVRTLKRFVNEGTDFSESKKYSKVLKNLSESQLSESQVRTLKRFVNEGLLSDTAKETKNSKIEAIIKQLRRLSNTLDSTGDNMKPSKINELLHKIENGVMERLEDIQDLLVKQAEKVKESK